MTRKLVFAASLMIIVVGMLGVASDLLVGYASPYTDVDVYTAYNMITNGSYPDLVVLDVRNQSEYDSGHIYGAVWIPHTELEARISELAGHEDHEIIAYCLSGGRSATASGILDSNNFTKVYNMLGGFSAWQSSGYQVWIATVHNLNTTINYDTIQAAIDAPQTLCGHTIFVEEGIFYENLVMNKSLTLIGENSSTTIIDGNGQHACIVNIVADDVVMSGFTMRNNRDYPGIYLENSSYCVIRYNIFIDIQYYAISSIGAEHCRIEANNFSSSNGNWGRGIQLRWSDNNTIADNQIMTHNDQYCIWLHNSSDCKIRENWLANGVDGLMIEDSYGCLFKKNLIEDCERAIDIGWAVRGEFVANLIRSNYYGVEGEGDEWIFYHNNFVNNTHQAYVSAGEGDWNNTLEGNYWDDYTGADSNHDGIGDTEHVIDANNTDNYPLMGMFSSFNATSEYQVQTICNSTISDFQFNNTAITFNVSGEAGTLGFCRICIPKALMNETYRVFVNGTVILPVSLPLPCSNSTHNYLYFTYSYSTQEVVIIPEFPSFLVLPLFMIATILAVVVYRKRPKMSKE